MSPLETMGFVAMLYIAWCGFIADRFLTAALLSAHVAHAQNQDEHED
jgi:hypothetical protein